MPHSIPMVIDSTNKGERAYDIYSRLLKDRIVMLDTQVDSHISSLLISQLLFLESENDTADISMFINSPGGSVTAGMAIYDVMQYIKPDVCTYVVGQAASMGSFLANAGAAGKRFVMPNARHMIHQPSGGAQGMVSDIEISYKEITFWKKRLTDLYVHHNTAGKTAKQFTVDMDRDKFMSAEEAVAYGLADKVVHRHGH